MHYLLKLFPEITIKSRPVRKRMIKQLRKNVRSVVAELDPGVQISREWDNLQVESSADELQDAIHDRLCCIPGIAVVCVVESFPLPDMEGMLELAIRYYGDALEGKTFAVRCKRSGRHGFRSVDVERYVGGGLNQKTGAAGVKLVDPDVTVSLEIRNDTLFVMKSQVPGLGGYPLGCQDSVLSLISGGFDSSVSSYLCIKRGLQTHYCFFNLGGNAHEVAVKEVALYLWMKYHSSHRVKFVSVPFEEVVREILQNVENSQMGVILKRMMVRAGEAVARQLHLKSLVTGESVAQVSSQTLANLSVIDSACDMLVLRPLCMSDKQEIIDIARSIGTEEFSSNIPEYCAVISDKPTTKARPERIEAEEVRFDFKVLDDALARARVQVITDLVDEVEGKGEQSVRIESEVADDCVVIDIRHPDELATGITLNPSTECLQIPFYTLRTQFAELDQSRQYLLYCDRGMMSRLHASHLMDEGFTNVGVYAPD